MNSTGIEYLDYTLNLIVGCSGDGCVVRHVCWARRQAKRRLIDCDLHRFFIPHYHFEWLEQPLSVKKSARIGLNFMGETFDKVFRDFRPDVWKDIFEMVRKAYWHRFLILTKQPQNIPADIHFPENLALGVSVNRVEDLWRVGLLRKVDVKLKVVSAEPLLEDLEGIDLENIGWLIIGAQTRPYLRPAYYMVSNLVVVAYRSGIPIFLKNNLHLKNLQSDPQPSQEYPSEWRLDGKPLINLCGAR